MTPAKPLARASRGRGSGTKAQASLRAAIHSIAFEGVRFSVSRVVKVRWTKTLAIRCLIHPDPGEFALPSHRL